MIFQQILAEREVKVRSLAKIVSGTHVAEQLQEAWEEILEVDYFPIFKLAADILSELSGNAGIDDLLKTLATSALRITRKRAALKHDLMGRIYHRLLADAKFFGAYYTTVPAATLLLRLTLDPVYSTVDWSSPEDIQNVRIGDLACGTGTLLKAALEAIVDNHVHARAKSGQLPELQSVHSALVEEGLYGLDVIPFAIHLAASALAMHEPDVRFQNMQLYTLPLSGVGSQTRLGSLELISGRTIPLQADLFGSPLGATRMTGAGGITQKIEVPLLDLCVMNPPFTRSVGGNLLFGNLPKKERSRMQNELKKVVRSKHLSANITAGLGSVFTAIGHSLVKPNGHLALVLPRALLSGVAWEPTRQLIGKYYYLRYVIVSNQPGHWAFSENSNYSECLIVARRLEESEKAGTTKFINLWRKPGSSTEAVPLADAIREAEGSFLGRSAGTEELTTDSTKFGEVVLAPAAQIKAGQWSEEAAFAQTELCRTAYYLRRGRMYIPRKGLIGNIPMTPLGQLGELGPDRRDIHDGFKLSASKSAYPALWGHNTESVQQIEQTPNRFLSALTKAKKGRHLRDPKLLWSRAGRLLIAERLWLDTIRTLAVRLNDPVLSNTWWPVAVSDSKKIAAEDAEKILAIWLNSTFGVISLIAARVDTRGPWIELKKPLLESIPVLEPAGLGKKQLKTLVDAYNDLADKDLSSLPEIDNDSVRADIDAAIMQAFGFSVSSKILRELMAEEPLVVGARTLEGARDESSWDASVDSLS